MLIHGVPMGPQSLGSQQHLAAINPNCPEPPERLRLEGAGRPVEPNDPCHSTSMP